MFKRKIGLLPAAVGTVALAGGLIAPGIANAAEGDPPAAPGDTVTVGADDRVKMSATGNNDCTVDFTITDEHGPYKGADGADKVPNWTGHYQVDDEAHTLPGVYRPVVTSSPAVMEAGPLWDLELDSATVNLKDERRVPAPAEEAGGPSTFTTLPGVNGEVDEHVITFNVYRGIAFNLGEDEKGSVTVTGCETADEDETNGSLDFGSIDFGSSLGSQE